MSFSNPLKFTNAGREVQLQALAGKELIFTTVRMGDGELSSAISVMTELINERAAVSVNTVAVNSQYATIEAIFNNTDLTEGFYWREFGIYVADPDDPDNRDSDILYAYQNAGELAEYINSPGSSVIEKIIRIPIFVGDAENVSVNVSGIVHQEATVTQEEASDIENDDYLTFYDSSDLKNRKIPFSKIEKKTNEAIAESMSSHIPTISNPNLVPNILPLVADKDANISANPTTLASVPMLHFGDVKWVLKMSGTQTAWSVFVGDIGDGTDDENFGGVCKRYVGYEKPAGSGHQCYGLFCRISACNKTVFKAGNYTLSFWSCVEGTSANLCPHITTSEPTKALGDNIGDKIGGITIGKWQKIVKTVNIPTDTDSIYVILDSFAPDQTTHRKLRCADIKLEYGEVATRFDPDYSNELILKTLYEMQNGG